MKCFFFIGHLLFFSVLSLNGQNCNKSQANVFLNKLFQEGDYVSYDSTQFKGYNKKLSALNTPLLNKLLPNYCFFSTTFFSHDYEYDNVETVLAFSSQSNKKSLLIHSPVFTYLPENFVHLFYGIESIDTSQSAALAKEITNIFSVITYEGRVGRLINLKERGVISFELWHSNMSWRFFDFYFDDDHRLISIKIKPGVSREKISENYQRQ